MAHKQPRIARLLTSYLPNILVQLVFWNSRWSIMFWVNWLRRLRLSVVTFLAGLPLGGAPRFYSHVSSTKNL